MSEFGTVIIDRGLFNHAVFQPEAFTQREAWLWLIISAVKRPRELRRNNIVVRLERGQLSYSQRFMAKRWNWTVAKVQRFLSRLVTESMIKLVTESDVTCVTIVNYDKWQSVTDFAVSESHPSQQDVPISVYTSNEKPPDKIRPQGQTESGPSQIRGTLTSDSRDSIVDDGVARARESFVITQDAVRLADEVMQTLGIDIKFIPGPWNGFAMWVQAGLNHGWRPELVRIAAARIRARKRYEVPFNFRYLAKPIQREHELAAEPHLPIPPVLASQTEGASHGPKTRVASDWRASRDNFRATFAAFAAADDESASRHDGRAEVVRFATPAGRR